MDEQDKRIGEATLDRLCKGAQIGGIRFGPILQILIGGSEYAGTSIGTSLNI